MNHRQWLGLTLMTGLLLCLLAVPGVLAQTIPRHLSQPPQTHNSAEQQSASPPSSPPGDPLLAPGNPTIHPISNTCTAPATTTISITYDEPINPASVSTRTFAVYAMQTGLLTQTYTVSGGDISLMPLRPFKPGELVRVSATTGTLNLSGQGPISPTVWEFRVAVGSGYAYFTDSGQTFPFSDTTAVALGDLDGDGDLDTLVANGIDQANEVWLNDGMGVFTNSNQSLGTISSLGMALGDLDRDGDLDAYIASAEISRSDEIWFNNGGGVFTRSNRSLTSSSGGRLALGDLDGDGDLDAFLGGLQLGLGNANQVWLNDGTGVFTDSHQRLGNSDTNDIALGDLDGDGDLDAFAANGTLNQGQPNQVWLNDGKGVFDNPYPDLGSTRSTAVALGDLDGDGDLDAFITNHENQPNEVWLNIGSGLFSDSGQRLGNADSWDVELGDMDGDGDLDAFVANANLLGAYGEPNRVWLNNGAGIFTPTAQSLGDASSVGVGLGDLDEDGDLDAFVANADTGGYNTSQGDPDQVWLNTQPQLYLPIIMANNGSMFEVSSVRQLTACENQGRHHIFTRIVDSDGDGLSDIPIQICWGPGTDNCAVITTNDAGWAVFAMFKGVYSVQVASGTSQVASGITADFGIEEVCEETGEIGNYRFHYSYEVIFIKTG